MLKFEQRSVIKFLTKVGNGQNIIIGCLLCMENMPSYYQVGVCSIQFKWGSNLVEDDPKLQRAEVDDGPK